MKKKITFFLTLSFAFLLSCSNDPDEPTTDYEDVSESYDTNTQDIDVENAITITYIENGVKVNNPYNDIVTITTEGFNVVINSSETSRVLNYVISGQTTNGSLKVYSTYKYGLILNGVSIINTTGSAINLQSSKKATITLIAETKNRLVDGTSYNTNTNEDMKAAFFSEGQLVFEGTGNLSVTGRYKHAISSDDYIQINNGSITINATKDGIHTNDYFNMTGGKLSITSANDGIECEEGYISIEGGQLTITSKAGDGIKTSYNGTENTISKDINITGGRTTIVVTGEAAKGIKSKGNFNITSGQLMITTTGNAYYNIDEADTSSAAGIKVDENMTISNDAILTVTSSGSGGKGINVSGTLTFDGGTTTVTTTGDQYTYNNNKTASKAIKSTGNLTINQGTIKIKTSKSEAEGLETKDTLTINGGLIEIEAYDDAINASKHIEITGGTIYCTSEVNDAIDSNGTLTISGGTVIAIGSSAPEAGFDCDSNTFKITGGILVGIGGSTSKPTSNVCTQYSLIYGAKSYSLVNITSANGDNILTFKSPKTLNNTTLLFSSPSLLANTNYSIYTGGEVSGGSENHGLYIGSTYSGGSLASTFNTSSLVSNIGSSSGGGIRP